MNPKTRNDPDLLFVSTADDALIRVDIINGLSGHEFSRLRMAAPLGSAVVWRNRTAVTQLVQFGGEILRLTAARGGACEVMTPLAQPGELVGRLQSAGAASITIMVTEENTA
ncbi:MAG: hypothetical protein U1G07_20700 [Verrucomicrobiota bacterium]